MLSNCLILTVAFGKSTKMFPGSISIALFESTRTSEEGGQVCNISLVKIDADVIEIQMNDPKIYNEVNLMSAKRGMAIIRKWYWWYEV